MNQVQQNAIRVFQRQQPSARYASNMTNQLARRRYMSMMGFGQTDDRYIPTTEQIVSIPSPGLWYRLKKGDTYWDVSKKAYGKANVKKGLYLMDDSSWNSHIDQGPKGWEVYKRDGLQATPHYSAANPHAPKGSGSDYPTVWVPPMSGAEPEDIYKPGIGPIGPQGGKGAKGDTGAPGDPGAPGRAPTAAEIESVVLKLMAQYPEKFIGPAGPPGEATEQAIIDAVNQIIAANPDKFRGPPGEAGAQGPPGEATEQAIIDAVNQIIAANPDKFRGPPGAQGERGLPGERGERGLPGAAGGGGGTVDEAAILESLKQFIEANPDKYRGPQGEQGERGSAGTSGEGGRGNNMWVLPLVAVIASTLG